MKYQHVKSLFKYKKIDEKLLSGLKQNKIYAPVIDQLNDPFESHIYISGENRNSILNTDAFIKNNIEVFKEYSNRKISEKKLLDVIKNNTYDNNMIFPYLFEKENENKLRILVERVVSTYGIISFSLDNHSLLMWSHYSDSHKGLCLEFERSNLNTLGDSSKCFPVQYSSLIKEIDYTNNEEVIADIFRLKSDVWAYEKEWRLILRNGKMIVDFPGKLKAIYFGLKTTDSDIESIKKILKYSIKYYRAYIIPNLYNIEFKEIRD